VDRSAITIYPYSLGVRWIFWSVIKGLLKHPWIRPPPTLVNRIISEKYPVHIPFGDILTYLFAKVVAECHGELNVLITTMKNAIANPVEASECLNVRSPSRNLSISCQFLKSLSKTRSLEADEVLEVFCQFVSLWFMSS
jgi:hypothetical protein